MDGHIVRALRDKMSDRQVREEIRVPVRIEDQVDRGIHLYGGVAENR